MPREHQGRVAGLDVDVAGHHRKYAYSEGDPALICANSKRTRIERATIQLMCIRTNGTRVGATAVKVQLNRANCHVAWKTVYRLVTVNTAYRDIQVGSHWPGGMIWRVRVGIGACRNRSRHCRRRYIWISSILNLIDYGGSTFTGARGDGESCRLRPVNLSETRPHGNGSIALSDGYLSQPVRRHYDRAVTVTREDDQKRIVISQPGRTRHLERSGVGVVLVERRRLEHAWEGHITCPGWSWLTTTPSTASSSPL